MAVVPVASKQDVARATFDNRDWRDSFKAQMRGRTLLIQDDFTLAYTRALEFCRSEGLLAGPSSGLIYEGARRIVERDQKGFGVMIFPDNIFKYTSNMIKHIPELATGTTAEKGE